MTTRKIAVISAGLSQPSSTRLLADRIAEATERQLGVLGIEAQVEFVELRDTAQDVVNNLLTGFPSAKLEAAIDTVTGADAVIAVTPIFTTSYSGMFKSFVDVLDPQSLTDMPILIAATGGSERHSLALDYALRPLFTYLHANVATTSVYAASSDWGSVGDSVATALPDRIERAARELAAMARESDRSSRVVDPFALPAGFSPVGGYGAQ